MEKKEEFRKWLMGRIVDRGGMSHLGLANAMGVSESTARRIMIGEKMPTVSQIIALAYVFGDSDHVYDLLDLAGYSEKVPTIRQTRQIIETMQNHPEVLSNKDTSNEWWAYYEQRRDDW